MFKKTLIAVAAIAATAGVAFANGGSFAPAPAADHNCTAYIGAQISRDISNYELSFSSGSPLAATSTTDVGADGIDGGVYLGAGMTYANHYYLGAETFFDATSNEAKSSVISSGTTNEFSIKEKFDAGVDAVLGLKVTDSTLAYGKVGYVNGEFEFGGNDGSVDFSKVEKHASGIQAGFGMKAMVTQNIGVRGEWLWNRFEHISNNVTNSAGVITNQANLEHPTVDQFKLGIDYNFNFA